MKKTIYILILTMMISLNVNGAVALSDGDYIIGEEVQPGTYTIVAVSGTGYVWTDKDAADSLLGVKEGYKRKIKGIELKKDDVLHISGGIRSVLNVRLIKE